MIRRILSVTLCVILILSVLSLVASAEGGEPNKVTVLPKRFCTNEITVENAASKKNNNGSVRLFLDGEDPKISMDFVPLKAETRANSLRVVLVNESTVNEMIVNYVYKDANGTDRSGRARADVLRSSENAEYIVPVTQADDLINLAISFKSEENPAGEITITSIGAVSYAVDGGEYVGTLSLSEYGVEGGRAQFSGTVSYETVLANPEGKVVLYKLGASERIEDVDFTYPCVDSCPITLNFKFDFKVDGVEDVCSRYFAAVLTKDNEIIPITAEAYLTAASEKGVAEFEGEIGFKGIETAFYAGAVESGTSVAFIDIYLNKLENKHGDGYQYILSDGREYYFDRNYISEIDAAFKSYDDVGASIYFRFLLDSCDPSFSSVPLEEQTKNVEYFAIDPRKDEAISNLYACADFIASRYTGDEYNSLRGVVLGRSLDNPHQYNYCGAISMSDYADMLARAYGILKQAFQKTGVPLEIVLPMSDNILSCDGLITVEVRDKKFPSNMLSDCVLKMITQYGFDASTLYFMLESADAPIVDPQFNKASDLSGMVESIRRLSDKYKDLPDEILFCWYPSIDMNYNDVISSYVYNYNLAACTEGVRGYIVSLSQTGSNLQNEEDLFKAIKNTYKYVDTQSNRELGKNALSILGADSWEDVFGEQYKNNTVKRTLKEESLLYSLPSEIIGTYNMWDFSKVSGTAGWSVSESCSSLTVYTPYKGIPRSLTASFKAEAWGGVGAEYGSIIYRSSDLAVAGISGISFDLIIPSNEDDKYGIFEVKIIFGSDDFVLETSGIIKENVRTTVYSDISSVDKVEYVKISIRPLESKEGENIELLVSSVSIHSEDYYDSELEEIVLSGKIVGDPEKAGVIGERDVMFFVLIIIGIVSMWTIWGVFWTIRRKQKG